LFDFYLLVKLFVIIFLNNSAPFLGGAPLFFLLNNVRTEVQLARQPGTGEASDRRNIKSFKKKKSETRFDLLRELIPWRVPIWATNGVTVVEHAKVSVMLSLFSERERLLEVHATPTQLISHTP